MSNRLYKYELGAGAGVAAGADSGKLVLGDNFPSTTSTGLFGLCADRSGNIYMSDPVQSCIYKITESGYVQLFAGTHGTQGYANGQGTAAKFSNPRGVAVDKSGNIYIADAGNGRIRKIDSAANVTTVAGGFTLPVDVAVGPNGDIIVCDQTANKIYRIEPGGRTYHIAGSGAAGDAAGVTVGSGVKIKGSTATFNAPESVAVNQFGDIFVADTGNNKVKKICSDGWVVRFSGTTKGNVNGVANTAKFTSVKYIAAHPLGQELYVIDNVRDAIALTSSSSSSEHNSRIKKIDNNGTVSTVAYPDATYDRGDFSVRGITVSPANKLFVIMSDSFTWNENSSSSSSKSSQSTASESSSLNSSSSNSSSLNSSSSSSSKSSNSSSSSLNSSSSSGSSSSSVVG